MTVEQLKKSQELIVTLQDGLETQQEVLTSLAECLQDYADFLLKEIKGLRDES